MPNIDFAPGGQAVIEGVLMRSPTYVAVAVRKKDGEIIIDRKKYISLTQRIKVFSLPFIRGVISIGEMMVIGFKALNFSATVFSEMGEIPGKISIKEEEKKSDLTEKIFLAFSILFALSMSLFLFKFVPLGVATFLSEKIDFIKNNFIIFNLIDGMLKTGIFIGYVALLLVMKDMRRVFEYHGAEHKAVYTYEKKLPLTIENAKIQSRFHPRCGTSFIMIVILISILTYSVLPRAEHFLENFLLRVAWLPLIAAISYESLKLSAKNMQRAWVKVLVAPGLWFQKLTTQEPDDAQIEVALRALENTLDQ